MPTYYLDYELGNDTTGDGSIANPWKTITLGATAARIAAGDEIRIAKSPDPVSVGNATWTVGSATVTLATAQTANIETCDGATGDWVASADVAESKELTIYKEGSGSRRLAVAAGFTTGIIAYKDIATLNLSGYQKVSFWIRSSVALVANTLRLDLCSDNAGATPVNSFTIAHRLEANRWYPLTFDNAGALGSAIESVALATLLDPGTPIIYLDNILACNGLNLQSFLGKGGSQYDWWPIKSINGTTVVFGRVIDQTTVVRNYQGDSETVESYRRETIKTDLATATQTIVNLTTKAGTITSHIVYRGGWNMATDAQDGETWFDGLFGWGWGIYGAHDFLEFERLSFTRYDRCWLYIATDYSKVTRCHGIDSETIHEWRNIWNTIFTDCVFMGNQLTISMRGRALLTRASCLTGGNQISLSGPGVFEFRDCAIKGGSGQALLVNTNVPAVHCYNLHTARNAGGVYHDGSGVVDLVDSLIEEAGEFGFGATNNVGSTACIASQNHDRTAGNHYIRVRNGIIRSETTVRHTASGLAWRMEPLNATLSLVMLPAMFKTGPVEADKAVTITAWVRKSAAYNGAYAPKLILLGSVLSGILTDAEASLTVAADEWEQLSVSGTPTQAGVLEFFIECIGTAGYVYVDDIAWSQAA